jgi:hypothetical protein
MPAPAPALRRPYPGSILPSSGEEDRDDVDARPALRRAARSGVPDDKAREAAEEVAIYAKDLVEIKSGARLLEWTTGATLAGILALVIRTFTS